MRFTKFQVNPTNRRATKLSCRIRPKNNNKQGVFVQRMVFVRYLKLVFRDKLLANIHKRIKLNGSNGTADYRRRAQGRWNSLVTTAGL